MDNKSGSDFLVVLTKQCARPPFGLEHHYLGKSQNPGYGDINLQRKCSETLEDFSPRTKSRNSRRVVHLPDGGGFSMNIGPYCHYAHRDGVSAVFSGEIGSWPGIDVMKMSHDAFMRGDGEDTMRDDAAFLLDFYDTFKDFVASDVTDIALSSLAKIEGRFAFVIYDGDQKRVLAARDRVGSQEMHWGVTDDGRFMFGSEDIDLKDCNPTATPFPSGTLYASEGESIATSPGDKGWVMAGEQWPGQLLSFMRTQHPVPQSMTPWRDVKAIPRVTSKGLLCGAVYRVASEQQLAPEIF
ncbi:hypothetical protein WJX75_003254 [Coccomyxa subellipsoidea]|uniref:DUF3700 domain-containing protein n=1 Tax=Coccomyxa subellipsoidea TaxID=248742 RepID=A0ABR2Z2K2_9CHLO